MTDNYEMGKVRRAEVEILKEWWDSTGRRLPWPTKRRKAIERIISDALPQPPWKPSTELVERIKRVISDRDVYPDITSVRTVIEANRLAHALHEAGIDMKIRKDKIVLNYHSAEEHKS